MAAAAAAILVIVRQADTAHARRHAVERAQLTARAQLAPELRANDLQRHVKGERRRQLDRLLRLRVLAAGVRAVTFYGSDGRQTYSIAAGGRASGATAARLGEALSGRTVSETVTTADGGKAVRTYVPIARADGTVTGVVRVDQPYGAIAATARRSLLIAGVLEGLLLLLFVGLVPVLARASSRIARHDAELEHVATHDELTGMPNRYAFKRTVAHAFRERDSSSIMLVDLDGFSEINSSLSSETGDRLLVEAGRRLELALAGDGAAVARLGEDEFGVLVEESDTAGAEWTARRIRHAFAAPFVVDGVRLAMDVHVGVATFPDHGHDVETVLGHAASALATAKDDGRSGLHIYDPAQVADDRCRLALVAELRDALANDQLRVHYQPQTDLLTHRIRGVEALVRWQHPERGLLPAAEFVTVCERSGLAQELRRFVLSTATDEWRRWFARGYDLELAINLTAVDMLDPALPDEIEEALSRNEMPPWNLILEVTERTLIADKRRAHHVVEQLGRIGVRLSIDDFGTGYSSLASLREFPVRQVKLDRSLLADVPGDEGAEAILGGSVEIAHGVGALVVAEGIETLEQLEFATAVGCDIAQGYLIGEPMPSRGLVDLLETPRLIPLSIA